MELTTLNWLSVFTLSDLIHQHNYTITHNDYCTSKAPTTASLCTHFTIISRLQSQEQTNELSNIPLVLFPYWKHCYSWVIGFHTSSIVSCSVTTDVSDVLKIHAWRPITHIEAPMIQNTVDPAEARMKSGRLIKKTSPYCSTRLNSRPKTCIFLPWFL